MPNHTVTEYAYITQEGIRQLKKKISFLKGRIKDHSNLMAEVVKDEGLLDESYSEIALRKSFRENELAEVSELLRKSKIIQMRKNPKDSDMVELGDSVKLENHKLCYQLRVVSSIEADPVKGWVSDISPIGQSIIGRRVGDEVVVHLPEGKIEFKIVSVRAGL